MGRKFFERLSKTGTAWQRVAFYCYAKMNRNGHRPMKNGELAKFLGKTEKETKKDVKRAIEEGWLAPNSNTRCLVAPPDVQYKAGNLKYSDCPFHDV